jgi:hypothetical protein
MNLDETSCDGDFTRPTVIVETFPDIPYLNNTIHSHYWSSTTSDQDPGMAWGGLFTKVVSAPALKKPTDCLFVLFVPEINIEGQGGGRKV